MSKCIDKADDLLLEEFNFTEKGIAEIAEKIAGRENPVGLLTYGYFSANSGQECFVLLCSYALCSYALCYTYCKIDNCFQIYVCLHLIAVARASLEFNTDILVFEI